MLNAAPSVTGRFIAVVGPSGAGKDSVMMAICAARPDLHRVRRVITRAPDAGGEAFDAVPDTAFAAHVADGDFALHWRAHGLSYGIPNSVHRIVAQGRDVMANLSRGALAEPAQVFDRLIVVHVSATPEILAQRVALRGRERGRALDRRLSRPAPAMPDGLSTVNIDNSGPLDASVRAALAALYPESV